MRPDQALTEEVDDTCATVAHVYGWEESVGEALGMSRRSIHRDLELFRLIIEPFGDLIEPLSRHPIVGESAAQLRAIAQVREEADRRRVIEALLADPRSARTMRASWQAWMCLLGGRRRRTKRRCRPLSVTSVV
jgi:hypothetical protein